MALISRQYKNPYGYKEKIKEKPNKTVKGRHKCLMCKNWYKRQSRPVKGGGYLWYIRCSNESCSKFNVEQELWRHGSTKAEVCSKAKKSEKVFPAELIKRAKIVVDTWLEAVEKFADYEANRADMQAQQQLNEDGASYSKHSVAYGVCNWIATNPDTWKEDWNQVLETMTYSGTLRHGFNGWHPDLNWLIGDKGRGSGILRIKSGRYERKAFGFRSEDGV